MPRSACPSISWTLRRSAPPSSRWVANEWRSRCGWTRPGSSPAAAASLRRIRKAPARVRAPPLAFRNSSARWRVSRCGLPRDEVALQGLDRLSPDRDDPLLAALADDPYEPLLEVDASLLDPHRLRDAQARAVEQLDERAVAQRPRRDAVRRLDQALDLTPDSVRGSFLVRRGSSTAAAGLSARAAHQELVAEERAGSRGPARDRRRREPVLAELGDVALDVLGARVSQPARRGTPRGG